MTPRERPLAAVALAAALALAGCAGTGVRRPHALAPEAGACAERLAAIDRAIDAAGVRDASSARIDGLPELRATRFLCGLGTTLEGTAADHAWLALLGDAARAARDRELANLPAAAVAPLAPDRADPAGRAALRDEAARCADSLLAADRADPALASEAVRACAVPDDYSLALRTVGLYPLTAPVVLAMTHSDEKKSRRWFEAAEARLPRQGLPVRFAPGGGQRPVSREEAGAILAASRANPLGVPFPDPGQLARLAGAYAPILEQDVAGPHDRPGRVEWQEGRIVVNPEVPLAYVYPSWALHRGAALLQLNYVFWYAKRSGPLAPWIERGPIDGVVARITLGDDGLPLVADFMLACGCYHGYAPVRCRVRGVRPRAFAPDPFAPVWLEDAFLPGRLALEIVSGWHRVEGATVAPLEGPAETVTYRLEEYAVLESLPTPAGVRESVFDAAGVLKGTERIERYLLFPMGIPSVGSLRQRGRQPTRLVGREHFDDPWLLERDFELP